MAVALPSNDSGAQARMHPDSEGKGHERCLPACLPLRLPASPATPAEAGQAQGQKGDGAGLGNGYQVESHDGPRSRETGDRNAVEPVDIYAIYEVQQVSWGKHAGKLQIGRVESRKINLDEYVEEGIDLQTAIPAENRVLRSRHDGAVDRHVDRIEKAAIGLSTVKSKYSMLSNGALGLMKLTLPSAATKSCAQGIEGSPFLKV